MDNININKNIITLNNYISPLTDAITGEPLQAEVWIDELNGSMLKPRYANDFGRYRRRLIEGTYTIHFDLFGYEAQNYTFVPSSSQITEYNVALQPSEYFDLSLNLNVPSSFDEQLFIAISSKGFEDTVVFEYDNILSPSWNLPANKPLKYRELVDKKPLKNIVLIPIIGLSSLLFITSIYLYIPLPESFFEKETTKELIQD